MSDQTEQHRAITARPSEQCVHGSCNRCTGAALPLVCVVSMLLLVGCVAVSSGAHGDNGAPEAFDSIAAREITLLDDEGNVVAGLSTNGESVQFELSSPDGGTALWIEIDWTETGRTDGLSDSSIRIKGTRDFEPAFSMDGLPGSSWLSLGGSDGLGHVHMVADESGSMFMAGPGPDTSRILISSSQVENCMSLYGDGEAPLVRIGDLDAEGYLELNTDDGKSLVLKPR